MVLQIYLLLLSYYLIRVVRETLILVEGSPEVRSYATGAIAVTLIFVIPLYKLLFDYLKNGGRKSAVITWVGGFFVCNILVFAFLMSVGVPIAVPFYVWVGVFNVMVIAQFWAFAADLFNIKTGQRLFAVIMVGAALGALSGSQVAARLYDVIGASGLMLLSAGLLGAVLALSRHAERAVPEGSRAVRVEQPEAPPGNVLSQVLGGFGLVLRSGYLLRIALFIMLLNLVNTTGGYILASFADDHAREVAAASGGVLATGNVLARFWGDYFAWLTGLQIVLQLFFVSRIFRWVGVRGAILVLPAGDGRQLRADPVDAGVRTGAADDDRRERHELLRPGHHQPHPVPAGGARGEVRRQDHHRHLLRPLRRPAAGHADLPSPQSCSAWSSAGSSPSTSAWRASCSGSARRSAATIAARSATSSRTCRPWSTSAAAERLCAGRPGAGVQRAGPRLHGPGSRATRCATQPAGPMAERSRPGSASTATTRPSPCNRRRTRPAASPWR
jgi:MFS family permease